MADIFDNIQYESKSDVFDKMAGSDIFDKVSPKQRGFMESALDFLTMGHLYGEYGPEREVSFDSEGRMTLHETPTGDPGFFQDPVTAIAMGGLAGAKAAGGLVNKGLAAGREALGWFTGGGSEVPSLVKAGGKGIVKAIESKPLAEAVVKRQEKGVLESITPEARVSAGTVADTAQAAPKAVPKATEFLEAKTETAPLKIVEPGATSEGKQPWEMTRAEFESLSDESSLYHATKSENIGSIRDKGIVAQAPKEETAFYYDGGIRTKTNPADRGIQGESVYTFKTVKQARDFAYDNNMMENHVILKVDAKKYSVIADPEYDIGESFVIKGNVSKGDVIDVSKYHENAIKQALSEGKPVPPEVLKEYPELAKASNSLIPEVKGGATVELPKYAEGSAINLEKYNTTDDLKVFLNNRTKELEEAIGKRAISLEETRATAIALGWDEKEIVRQWKKKGAFSAAEIDATRQTNLNAITDLHKMIMDLPYDKTTLTPEIRAKYLDVMDLIKVTSQAASEAGRALNVHKRILEKDPSFTDASQMAKILRLIEGKGGKRTDKMILGLRNIDMNDPAAVNRFIYDYTKTKWEKLSDGAFELWMNGLLSHPLTHVINTTSNALTMAYTYPERLLATGVEAGRAAITGGKRGIFFGETAQEVFAVSKGLQDAWARFGTAMKKGDTATKLDFRPSVLPESIASKMPTRALLAEDAFFKGFIENAELNRLAFRQAKKEGLKGQAFQDKVTDLLAHPTESMLEAVAKRGQYLTYQKELGEVGKLVFRVRDTVPGLKYFIPFVKTPLNIAKFALERTPFNLPVLAARAAKGELKGAALSEELAKPLMGTMMATTIYMLAKQGHITGGNPKNRAEKEEKLNTGFLAYSAKLGDEYYSFARSEPLGSIAGMAADFAQMEKEMTEDEKYNLAAGIMASITTNISNKTFMQGFSNLIQSINDPGRYMKNTIKTLAGSAIPSVSAGVARSIDPYVRDTDAIGASLKARIPFLSETLPAKLTVWGDPVERPGSAVGRFISPVQTSTVKGSPIEKEMLKLDLDIGYPSRKIGNVELESNEYWMMVKAGGVPAKQELNALVQAKGWDDLSDYKKEQKIRSVVGKYRDKVGEWFAKKLYAEGRLEGIKTEKEFRQVLNKMKISVK